MRITQLTVQNFKGFKDQTFDFHPQFTLLAGDNGSGKTSILDALAVAIGLWHTAAQGRGWRNILLEEVRIEAAASGDRISFQPMLPTKISATGSIGARQNLRWIRRFGPGGRTVDTEAREAAMAIQELVQASTTKHTPLPVLAYYGAGRAWFPTNKRPVQRISFEKIMPLDAYNHCLDTRIRDQELNKWVLFETAAAHERNGERPGFMAVKQAVLGCIPGADSLRFDTELQQIILSIQGREQPFYNLSAGQRMMLALAADIAIKAVKLNSFLLDPLSRSQEDSLRVLRESPGLVLIDELDVHLHPEWQRRVASDLKRTFPAMQFVCTSHSPQVLGELSREEIRILFSCPALPASDTIA